MIERFSTSLESELMKSFDAYLRRRGYPNRSEGVRDLIRKALVADEWAEDRADVMGVITLVYDHHRRNVLERITDLQHDAQAMIVSTTHVHMDHHNCLEIIIARGHAGELRLLSDRLRALQGVKSGALTAATTGRGLD